MKKIWSGREAASAQLSLPDQEKRSSRCLTRHIHAIRGRSLWLRGPFDTSLLSVMTAQTWRSATSLPEYDFWAAPFRPNSTLSLEDHCCWGKPLRSWSPAQFSEDFGICWSLARLPWTRHVASHRAACRGDLRG